MPSRTDYTRILVDGQILFNSANRVPSLTRTVVLNFPVGAEKLTVPASAMFEFQKINYASSGTITRKLTLACVGVYHTIRRTHIRTSIVAIASFQNTLIYCTPTVTCHPEEYTMVCTS